jgi:uncharacterized protein (DUF433 family)
MNKQALEPRITIVPGLCGGMPTIRGMRVTVASILELLASGMSQQEILIDYPYLEAGDLKACLDYAAKLASYHAELTPESSS